MARFAEVVTQTFRSFTPEALSERLFGDSLDDWWQEYVTTLEKSDYTGQVQTAFFITTFAAMGRLAKVDGRIHEKEIALANSVMDHLKLDPGQKRLAIRLFNEGKQSDFNLDTVLNRFFRLCRHRVSVLQIFIEIQLQAAFADGALTEKEETLLSRMCKRLDVSHSIYGRIERRVRTDKLGQNYQPATRRQQPMSLADACELLNVTRWTSRQDIKQAYRRKMSQHHPDKMLANGAPQADVDAATEMVQEIKQAYEILCKAKKII
ncbi:MAG: co-chaperone DjlA [Gammaproteobacteria bacterium]|nr:co-chaperone DjlA [Gammaproteobacteria bacterium]